MIGLIVVRFILGRFGSEGEKLSEFGFYQFEVLPGAGQKRTFKSYSDLFHLR